MDNLKETEEVTFDNFAFCGTSEGFFSMIDYTLCLCLGMHGVKKK